MRCRRFSDISSVWSYNLLTLYTDSHRRLIKSHDYCYYYYIFFCYVFIFLLFNFFKIHTISRLLSAQRKKKKISNVLSSFVMFFSLFTRFFFDFDLFLHFIFNLLSSRKIKKNRTGCNPYSIVRCDLCTKNRPFWIKSKVNDLFMSYNVDWTFVAFIFFFVFRFHFHYYSLSIACNKTVLHLKRVDCMI